MIFPQLAASFAEKIDFGVEPSGITFCHFLGVRVTLRPDSSAEHFLNFGKERHSADQEVARHWLRPRHLKVLLCQRSRQPDRTILG